MRQAMRIVLKNAQVFNESAIQFDRSDVLIDAGRIVEIAPHIAVNPTDTEINLEGCHIFPGFVDVHVHFREPGFSYKETIATDVLLPVNGL